MFLAAIAWIASRLYREHRVSLYSLGDRKRLILYVAAGVATLTFTASGRLLDTGLGSIVWILLLGGLRVRRLLGVPLLARILSRPATAA